MKRRAVFLKYPKTFNVCINGETDGIQIMGNGMLSVAEELQRIVKKIPERDFLKDARNACVEITQRLFTVYDGFWITQKAPKSAADMAEVLGRGVCNFVVTVGGAVRLEVIGSPAPEISFD